MSHFDERFAALACRQIRLLMMNFISRVIGGHRLLVLPFYSHLQRYVVSQQREVTHILAYLVQACHDLVPPNEVGVE